MSNGFRLGISVFAAVFLAACQSNPTSLSEDTIQDSHAEFEKLKAEQIHDEYWQAQMERDEAAQAARERANERAEATRRSME